MFAARFLLRGLVGLIVVLAGCGTTEPPPAPPGDPSPQFDADRAWSDLVALSAESFASQCVPQFVKHFGAADHCVIPLRLCGVNTKFSHSCYSICKPKIK